MDGIQHTIEEGSTWRNFVEKELLPEGIWLYEDEDTYFKVTDYYYNNVIGVYVNWNVKDANLNNVLLDDVIKNGDIIYANGDITFYYEDMEYYAINGMTWSNLQDWRGIINPHYCEELFGCDQNNNMSGWVARQEDIEGGWCIGQSGYVFINNDDNTRVKCDDIIIPEHHYKAEIVYQ